VNFYLNTRAPRGVFGLRVAMGISDIPDGSSNTVLMSERLRNPNGGNPFNPPAPGPMRQNEGSIRDWTTVVANPGSCYTAIQNGYFIDPTRVSSRAGSITWDGQTENVGFNTVIPPNGPSCVNNGANADSTQGVLPPGSRHSGGAHCLMGDGAVRFISENIDSGNLAAPDTATTSDTNTRAGQSPYGVWGALGSRNGGDTVGEF
jgi:prepilin-type processing-associated H-X9-DG protein